METKPKIFVEGIEETEQYETMSRPELLEILKNWKKIAFSGVNFMNIQYFCPEYASKQKDKQHILQKLTTTRITVGSNYEDKINRLLAKQGEEKDFEAQAMKGRTYPYGHSVPIVENKDGDKMLVMIVEHHVIPDTRLFYQSEPIDRKKAEELQLFTPVYYKPKEPTVGRGRIEEENEFFFRTLGLSRILKIKINGKLYKIVD
jgi:hypothetical protein